MSGQSALGAKTPVTELQEICARRKVPLPIYESAGEDNSTPAKIFSTSVTALGQTCVGHGRSKKDSKHAAALHMLKLLASHGESGIDLEDPQLAISSSDKVMEVRDICVQRNFEVPEFECVRSSGPSHAPEFEFECRVGNIVRRGVHNTKKGAKQVACNEMLKTLQAMPVEENMMQVQSLDQAAKMDTDDNEHIIRNYREYKNSDIKKKLGVKIADRHNYFAELEEAKIDAARSLAMDETMDVQEKCALIPRALGLKFDMKLGDSQLQAENGQKLYSFELMNSEYDCFIFGLGNEFYESVYRYFTTMLNFSFKQR
uniref:Interferon-inducible double-stranded RNA-dependent protein kinase activator A n=2 Tax=Culex pipiens TaxID=7175 RepID=A0A8D8KVE9_CULPI